MGAPAPLISQKSVPKSRFLTASPQGEALGRCFRYAAFFVFCLMTFASLAMNSPLVGLPFSGLTVLPKYLVSTSISPRSQVTSTRCRMARSTREAVVSNRAASWG